MNSYFNKDISKGGLAGAILGMVVSTQIHKTSESLAQKSVKTGIWAATGYAFGSLIERLLTANKQSTQQ